MNPKERTLSIIKPDAMAQNIIGKIIDRFEEAGLRVVAARMVWMTKRQAEAFYAVHFGKPFFDGLVTYMSSGPVFVQVLEGPNAILKNREIMGATDPQKAAAGTLRRDFGKSFDANVAHGSDAPETARQEIRFFFSDMDIWY